MITVVRWTGQEARTLRVALRMSVRDFAARSNLSASSIADMEAKGAQAKLRHATQQIFDELLASAPEEARHRFCATLEAARLQSTEADSTRDGRRVNIVLSPRAADGAATSGSPPSGQFLDVTATSRAPVVTLVTGATGREVDETNRRQALTTLGLAGAAVVSSRQPCRVGVSTNSPFATIPLDPDDLESGPGAKGVAAAYGEVSTRLWRLYWSSPAKPLFDAGYAQVRLGADLILGVTGTDRIRLASALALSALLTARLAFFDLNRPGAAASCHQLALAAADDGEDHTMTAVVLGHMAFGPAFAQKPEHAHRVKFYAWLREISTVLHDSAQIQDKGIHVVASRLSESFSADPIKRSVQRYADDLRKQREAGRLRMTGTGLLTTAPISGPKVPDHTFYGA